jgi:nucleotidyltransferase substrate binding protein (TIGR01987 family)
MEINKNIELFLDALQTLKDGIDLFYEYEDILDKHPSEKNEKLFKSMRDSLIQRFEYTVDLFWRLTKAYMIEIEKIDVLVQSPRGIIREAVKAKVFSEEEGDECMDMVEARNKTSHTYLEVMADEIAHAIPIYYDLLNEMNHRIQEALK